MSLISISGTDLVAGCRPGGMIGEDRRASDAPERDFPDRPRVFDRNDDVNIDPIAIVAFVLAIAGLIVSPRRSRKALYAQVVLAGATIVTLVVLHVKVCVDLGDAIAVEASQHSHDTLDAGSRWGLWLAYLGLVVVAATAARALRDWGLEPTESASE